MGKAPDRLLQLLGLRYRTMVFPTRTKQMNDAWPLKRRKIREAEKAALLALEQYAKKVRSAIKLSEFKPGRWEMLLLTRYEELERARDMPRTVRP